MKTIYSLLLLGLASLSSPTLAQDSIPATEKPPASASTAENFLIVPGQSIGQVKIGDSKAKVHQTLGRWSSTGINGPVGSGWERYGSEFDISYRDFKVVAIGTTSSKYKTAGGLSVGSNADFVRRAFKGGTLTKISSTLYLYTAAKPGIKFQFGNDVQTGLKSPPVNNQKLSTKECSEIIVTSPKP